MRFAEALQVSESQSEAHRLIARHLEATIPDSTAVALNRNNSADRLEPTYSARPGSPLLASRSQQAKPRSCLAVRLNRSYERSDAAEEIMLSARSAASSRTLRCASRCWLAAR